MNLATAEASRLTAVAFFVRETTMSNLKVEREKHGRSQGVRKESGSKQQSGWLAKRRAERNSQRGTGGVIEWASADGDKIISLIDKLVAKGCAVTFGATRDGGAIRFTVFDGEERVDEYCRPTEEIETFLAMLTEMYGAD